jgi:hypothetical protein
MQKITYFISHEQNTTLLHTNVFVTGKTSVTSHKQGTVTFHQRKPLPRSAANSTVSIYTCYHCTLKGQNTLHSFRCRKENLQLWTQLCGSRFWENDGEARDRMRDRIRGTRLAAAARWCGTQRLYNTLSC